MKETGVAVRGIEKRLGDTSEVVRRIQTTVRDGSMAQSSRRQQEDVRIDSMYTLHSVIVSRLTSVTSADAGEGSRVAIRRGF